MKILLLIPLISLFSNSMFAFTGYSNGDDTTRIKTKNKTYLIIDDEGDDFTFIEDTSDFEEKPNGLEVIMSLDVGMSGYLTSKNSLTLPPSQRMMEINYSKSQAVSANFMLKNANIVKDWFYVSPGVGIHTNYYSFKNNISISTGSDTTAFIEDTVISNSKYELRVTYVQVPLLLGFRFGNPNKTRVGLQFGAIAAFNTSSLIKQKYYLASSDTKQKNKIKDDFNINPFKVDLVARISIGGIGVFGKYSLTTLFESNKAPELYPFSVGFTFGGF